MRPIRNYNSRAIVRYAVCFASLGAVLTGCMHFHHQEFAEGAQSDTTRRLYEPIARGEQELIATLASIASEPVVYALSATNVAPVEGVVAGESHWDERRVVFYRLPGDGASGARWIYLSPRTLGVFELGRPLPADCDLVQTGENAYAVFRSVPQPGTVLENLEVYRYDFAWHPDTGVTFGTPERITDQKTADYHAVPIAGGHYVAYLSDAKTSPVKLMLASHNGERAGPVWPEQDFEVRYPRVLPDGRLVLAANPDGYFQLYAVEFGEGDTPSKLVAAPYPLPAASQNASVAYAVSARDGVMQPAILEWPDAIDLETITAMVSAHNPAINQRRAELAAALVEAGAAKLAGWPTISFGLEYERNTTVFVSKPELFPADLFTTGLTRGLLGFVQPLLDFRHNYAMSKADEWRAEGLRDILENEINDQVGDAAVVYFEALYLKQRIDLEAYWIAVANRRLDYYRTLRERGESYRLQILAAKQVIENLERESDVHQERYAFLMKQIGHLCGYPESAAIDLADTQYAFHLSELPPEQEMRNLALLNHPAMMMVDHALSEAYYLSETKAGIRPQMHVGGNFEVNRREFDRVVSTSTQVGDQTFTSTSTQNETRNDETAIIGLYGSLPLASLKARNLHAQSHSLGIQALELEKDAMARTIVADLEEAYTDFRAAQLDYRAKMASVSYYLEQVRLARVLDEHGLADNVLEVPLLRKDLTTAEFQLRPSRMSRDFVFEDTPLESQPVGDITAEVEYLDAFANLLQVNRDLGIRFARLWREAGLATQIHEQAAAWSEEEQGRYMTSAWLWYTKDTIRNDEVMEKAVKAAQSLGITRLYVYLEVDSRLLDNLIQRERFRHFVNLCFKHDIEVWGLLGEPEWMHAGADARQIVRGVERILEFNGKAGAREPRIAGVKLDLEPHSLPEWNADLDAHTALVRRYLALVQSASDRAGGALPVWVDCPPKFFNAENAGIIGGLEAITDGMTLMCYFDSENAMRKHAGIALAGYNGPVEIGIEFSDKSAPNERVRDWPADRVRTFVPALREDCLAHDNFAGLAYHDFDSVANYFKENEP